MDGGLQTIDSKVIDLLMKYIVQEFEEILQGYIHGLARSAKGCKKVYHILESCFYVQDSCTIIQHSGVA